jgi:hypothetical protein
VSLTARVSWPSAGEGGRTIWYRPGDQIPEDHPKRDWLLRRGIAVDGELHPAPAAAPDSVEPKHAAPEPVSDVEPEVKRPARAASVDMWRSYAVALGIDPKGLSKQEIIAATR